MKAIELAFWASIFFLIYTYFGYPLILFVLSLFKTLPPKKSYDQHPFVSVIISAYNEEKVIGAKLKNLLDQEYPKERLEVIVVSDGSTDKTDAIVRRFADLGVKLIKLPDRGGKPRALNVGVSHAEGEIILFSDSRQLYARDALKEIVANFGDESVGAVSGELHLVKSSDGLSEELDEAMESIGLYWRYEKLLRKLESRIDSSMGATGAIYAIRRDLFHPIPEDTILDDVLIPMRVVLQGYRVIFEPKAKAFDLITPDPKREFARRVRTLAGNFQLFLRFKELYSPFRNRILFQMISHKIFRLFIPFALISAFILNALLINSVSLYKITFTVQLFSYLSAFSGRFTSRGSSKFWGILSVPRVFLMLNAAVMVGLYRYMMGKQKVTWDKADVIPPSIPDTSPQFGITARIGSPRIHP
ncbi:TPA: glycosyltransferase family 2 protein [Candidatus Poribacteria bacterium]|nr:glycosyltransferase family 2 protein [Candidatus Poribacteria bacterium]